MLRVALSGHARIKALFDGFLPLHGCPVARPLLARAGTLSRGGLRAATCRRPCRRVRSGAFGS